MTEDDGVNDAFSELVDRMSDKDAATQVEICEVAEHASMVEVVVPITNFDHPEIALFETITEYLRSTPRRAVVGVSVVYEIRSHNLPHLIATLFLSSPL